MKRREAAVLTAYTGLLIGDFGDFHKHAEELMGRPVWTHEFGAKEMADELKEKSKAEFTKICTELED